MKFLQISSLLKDLGMSSAYCYSAGSNCHLTCLWDIYLALENEHVVASWKSQSNAKIRIRSQEIKNKSPSKIFHMGITFILQHVKPQKRLVALYELCQFSLVVLPFTLTMDHHRLCEKLNSQFNWDRKNVTFKWIRCIQNFIIESNRRTRRKKNVTI